MAVFRFEMKGKMKNKTAPWVYLTDNYLSFRAKGMLCLLYCVADEMELTLDTFAKVTTDSKGMIAATLKELQLLGYVKRVMKRDKYGRYAGVEYYVLNQPVDRTPACLNLGRDD